MGLLDFRTPTRLLALLACAWLVTPLAAQTAPQPTDAASAPAAQNTPPAPAPPAPAKSATPPAKSTTPPAKSTAPPAKSTAASAKSGKKAGAVKSKDNPVPYQPDRFAGRAGTYYRLMWGVDSLAVKWAESGEVIRFSYRVLDADHAKVLNDKKFEPSLIDPKAGVKLVVPSLENVGQLRQSIPPENGKSYWMVFSNKGRLVKRGDRVNVVIGQFQATGLVVD
jgi:outer membrane biosynthesis protein TonB